MTGPSPGREERLLEILRHDHPGWRVHRWPVNVKGRGTQIWWWAWRRESPTRQTRRAGEVGRFARPTLIQLMNELSNQLAISLLDHRRPLPRRPVDR